MRAAIGIALVLAGACGSAQPQPFRRTKLEPESALLAQIQAEPGVLDIQSVEVVLPELDAKGFELPVGNGDRIKVEYDHRVNNWDGVYTWYGTIATGGFAILVVNDGRVVGSIDTGREQYELRPAGRVHLLIHRGWDGAPPEDHGPFTVPEPGPPPPPSPAPNSNEPPTLTVLVLYTPAAKAGAQAAGYDIESKILLAIEDTAKIDERSDVHVQIVSAGIFEYPGFTEKQNFDDNVYALRDDPNETFAHGKRNKCNADLVVLVVHGGDHPQYMGSTDGVSRATEDLAYAVVDYRWLTCPFFTFGHELGHLIGANHDGEAPPDAPYAQGYLVDHWRTLMSEKCKQSADCVRKANWSSASATLDHDGVTKTGDPDHDNAKIVIDRAPIVEQFRTGSVCMQQKAAK